MTQVLKRFATQVALPLMIDTTQLDVLEAALNLVGGRAIINSVNLEDGEEKADRICELAREHGAALVALTIDEGGMAKSAEAKLAVARRIHDIAVGRHGLPAEALLFDALTFTIASGDEDSRKAGVATLDGIELIKRELPGVRTLLGLSNISFGLKPYPRQVLNSVFLAEAIARGLDAAILNQAKIIPLGKLDEEALAITRDLIYDRRREGYDPLFAFIARFDKAEGPGAAGGPADDTAPVEERLQRRIVDGKKVGIGVVLDEAMRTRKPLDIINNVLLEGMKTVGDLFGSGKDAAAVRAPVGRDHEDGGGAPRAAHGEGGGLRQGRDRARHRQGRRARHRQEPGRHHPQQQRLQREEPGHQGAHRPDPRRGGEGEGRLHRALGATGEVDGGDEGEPRADGLARLHHPGDSAAARPSIAPTSRATCRSRTRRARCTTGSTPSPGST